MYRNNIICRYYIYTHSLIKKIVVGITYYVIKFLELKNFTIKAHEF